MEKLDIIATSDTLYSMDATRILEITRQSRPLKVKLEYNDIKTKILDSAKSGMYSIDYSAIIFKENEDRLKAEGFRLGQNFALTNLKISWD